jgi:hypothetical protein
VNPLAAALMSAGELICEFSDGYRKSLLAEISGDAPRTELMLVYEAVRADSAEVLSTGRTGRRPVRIEATDRYVHLIQAEGPSVRVTTLTDCTRFKWRGSEEVCTRFTARHAWHFDDSARFQPDVSFARLPSGSATGVCEPWKID